MEQIGYDQQENVLVKMTRKEWMTLLHAARMAEGKKWTVETYHQTDIGDREGLLNALLAFMESREIGKHLREMADTLEKLYGQLEGEKIE